MTFALRIEAPRNGWLPLTLRIGDEELVIAASDVSNDPLDDIVRLATFVARGSRGRERAFFWLEPEGYELAAVREEHLALELRYDPDTFSEVGPRAELVARVSADATAVAAELLASISRVMPLLDERWRKAPPDVLELVSLVGPR